MRNIRVAAVGAALLGLGSLAAFTRSAAAREDAPAATLEEVLRGTLASEETVRIAAAEAEKAALRSTRYLLFLTPDVGLQASWVKNEEQTKADDGEGGGKLPPTQVGYALSLTQPLYTGGRAPAAYRAQKAVARSARLQAELTRRAALLGAAEAYYGALAAADAVRIAEQSLETAVQQLRLASRRVELGEAVLNDRLQAELGVQRAKGTLAAARGAVERARESVRRVSGRPLADTPAVPSPLPAIPGSPEDLAAEAAAQRFELEQGRLGVVAAEESVREKQGRFLPALALQASYARTGEELGGLAWRWSAGVSLSLPLYQSGQRLYELRESRLGVEQARLAAQAAGRDVEREVRGVATDIAVSGALLESFAAQVAAAEENHRLAVRRYEVGLADSIEVLDAQTALSAARIGRVAEGYRLETLRLRLASALGRELFPGLNPAPAGATP